MVTLKRVKFDRRHPPPDVGSRHQEPHSAVGRACASRSNDHGSNLASANFFLQSCFWFLTHYDGHSKLRDIWLFLKQYGKFANGGCQGIIIHLAAFGVRKTPFIP